MVDVSNWTSELPSGSSQLRKSDDQIRSDKSMLEALLNAEHYAFSTSSNVSAGVHQPGSARPYIGAASSVSTIADQGRLMWTTDAQQLVYIGQDSLRSLPSLGTENTFSEEQKHQVASETSVAFSILSTSGDTARHQVRGDGYHQWSDGHNAVDVNLYRGGSNLLQSDDTLQAANLHADDAVKGSELSSDGTVYGSKLAFGGDLSWYDGGTNTIKTDDYVWTTSDLRVDGDFTYIGSFNPSDISTSRLTTNSLTVNSSDGRQIKGILYEQGFIPAQTISAGDSAYTTISISGLTVGDTAFANLDAFTDNELIISVQAIDAGNGVKVLAANMAASGDIVLSSDATVHVTAFDLT